MNPRSCINLFLVLIWMSLVFGMGIPSDDNVSIAEDFINRAWVKIEEARRQIKTIQYDTCISASQECIELSVKGIFLLLIGDYRQQHEIKEEEFNKILSSTPEGITHINFARIWLLNKFWATFYTIAKYGSKQLKASAARLFQKEEAELALRHADEVYGAADGVKWWFLTSATQRKIQ